MKLADAKVLFVDDEPYLLEAFAKWIAGTNPHRIDTAADGQEALEKLMETEYDLLVTDVNMPRMNGIELVQLMAAMGKTLPAIVFVSGLANVSEREMYGLGVEAFLSKPVSRGTLLTTMERALADRSELWRQPFDSPPRQSLSIKARNFSDSTLGGDVVLGRGGFSAPYLSSAAPGKVAFSGHLSERDFHFAGEGYLRWKSKSEGTVGIEIAYLDEGCRSAMVEEIKTRRLPAFIPAR